MKKTLSAIIAIMLALSVLIGAVACDDDGTQVLEISGIQGVTDPIIDQTAKTVTFTVQNDRSQFPLTDIQFKGDYELDYEAYEDKGLTKPYTGDAVPLGEGLNVFYVKGWINGIEDVYEVFEFRITRLASAPSATSISVSPEVWKSDYLRGEEFVPCDLTVTLSNGTTQTVTLTESMLSGFDTSTVGTKTVTINYNGLTTTMTITVSEPAVDFTIGHFRTEYVVGAELDLTGAYIVVGETNVPITEDMVGGFDTSTEGDKTVTITYGGTTKNVTITVTAVEVVVPGGTEMDFDTFYAQLDRINAYFESPIDYGVTEVLYPLVHSAGIDVETMTGVVDRVVADGAPFLVAFNKFIFETDYSNEEMFAVLCEEMLSEESVTSMLNALSFGADRISAEGVASFVKTLLFAMLSSPDYNAIDDDTVLELIGYVMENEGYTNNDYQDITFGELIQAAGDQDIKDFITDYYTSSDSMVGSFIEAIDTDELLYVSSKLIDCLVGALDYDQAKVVNMISVVADVLNCIFVDGNLEGLLTGELEGMTYNDLAATVNDFGDMLASLNGDFALDPLVVSGIANVLADVFAVVNAFDDDIIEQIPTLADGIVAADKLVIGLLQNITAADLAKLYLDYDAIAKAAEEDQPVEIGRIVADVSAIVKPVYDSALTEEDKQAIEDCSSFVKGLFGLNLSGLVQLMNDATKTPVEDLTDDQLMELAQQFFDCFASPSIAPAQKIDLVQYSVALVPVGVQKDALVEAIKPLVSVYYYDNNSSMEIIDLERYAWTFSSANEGFFTATLTIEGATATVNCYAYDDTTADKFTLYADRNSILSIAIPQNGANLDAYITAIAEYINYSFPNTMMHKESGELFSIDPDTESFALQEVVTSELGLHTTIASYSHDVFDTISFPIAYFVYDATDLDAQTNITNVYMSYSRIIPQNAQVFYGSAHATYAYGAHYESYDLSMDNIDGLDTSVLGMQEFSITVPELGNMVFEGQTVKVVTDQEAKKLSSLGWSSDTFSMAIGDNFGDQEVDFSFNAEYSPYSVDYRGAFSRLADAVDELGVTVTLRDPIDTTQATDGIVENAFVISQNGKVRFERDFSYYVYDPAADPALVLDISGMDYPTFAQKDLADAEAFLTRIYQYDPSSRILWTNGDKTHLSDANIAELAGRATFSATMIESYDNFDNTIPYHVHFELDYVEFDHVIYAITDSYAITPTYIDVNPWYNYVLQDSTVNSDFFYANITFGDGYSYESVDMTADDRFTVDVDTSTLGWTTATVTFLGIIDTTFNLEVVPIGDYLPNTETLVMWNDPDYYNEYDGIGYFSGVISIEQSTTLADIEVSLPIFGYWETVHHHPIYDSYYATTIDSVNNFYDEVVNSVLYGADLHVEIDEFDTSTTGRKSASVYVVYTQNGEEQRVELGSIDYIVYPSDIAEGEPVSLTPTELFYGATFNRSEINDESFEATIELYVYDKNHVNTTTMTLQQLVQDHGATYDFVPNGTNYTLVISTEYAEAMLGNITIIEDVTDTPETTA